MRSGCVSDLGFITLYFIVYTLDGGVVRMFVKDLWSGYAGLKSQDACKFNVVFSFFISYLFGVCVLCAKYSWQANVDDVLKRWLKMFD